MNKTMKKVVSAVLSVALLASSVMVNNATADAAKSKTFTARVYFAGETKDEPVAWIAGDDTGAASKCEKKVKIVKGKKQTISMTVTNKLKGKPKVKGAVVFTFDLVGILKTFKNVKYSNVRVTADGKAVKCKSCQGYFESNKGNNTHRLSLYNTYGQNGDTSTKLNKASKFKFKKTITLTLDVVAK